MIRLVVYVQGTDQYNWSKSRVVNYRSSADGGLFASLCKGAKEDIIEHKCAWILITETELNEETGETTTKSAFFPGEKKEFLEINKQAKAANKITKESRFFVNQATTAPGTVQWELVNPHL